MGHCKQRAQNSVKHIVNVQETIVIIVTVFKKTNLAQANSMNVTIPTLEI